MKIRQKKIKRLDDRSLLGLSHTIQGRATDSLASAMKNLELDKRDMAMVHLINVFDYLMEYKNINHEVWKRYRKKKKEAREKAEKLKEVWKNQGEWTYLDYSSGLDSTNWWNTVFDTSDYTELYSHSLSEKAKNDE